MKWKKMMMAGVLLGVAIGSGLFAWNMYRQNTVPISESVTATEAETFVPHTIEVPVNMAAVINPNGIDPVDLQIPAIHVDAKVQDVGLSSNGQVDVPSNFTDVAWYDKGTKPGATGSAVIDGHVDSVSGPGVFLRLKDIKPGDIVIVIGKNKEKLTFAVTEVHSYPRNNAPLTRVFGNFGMRNLNLITCTGLFSTQAGTHEERLVVYTQLVSENH